MRTADRLMKIALVLLVLFSAVCSSTQTVPPAAVPAASSATQERVFLFVQRTDRHAKYSSPEMFNNVVKNIQDYLQSKNVAMAVDEFGGRNRAEGTTPLDTIFNIAADAKATSVMSVVVDRPATKWIKITVHCFDMNRKQLWEEEVSSGGGFSGAHGFDVATGKLHGQLDKRVGQTGLPVLPATASGATK